MNPITILAILTGGTIGSETNTIGIDLAETVSQTLATSATTQPPDTANINFISSTPYTIHSENLTPNHWTLLIQHIEAHLLDKPDGIIITHGTDTLAYTAAAVGLYFHQLPIPILLVSSDLPLSNPKANGLIHWQHAIRFIQEHSTPGCFIPYQNPNQPLYIHRGTRLLSCLPLSSDFISIQQRPFGSFLNNKLTHESQDTAPSTTYSLRPHFETSILLIKPYPGLDYRYFNLEGVTAVLHDLYHSGTTCTSDGDNDAGLLTFLARCKRHNIICFFAPAIKTGHYYPSTQTLVAYGGEIIWNMSLEAAYVKLLLAYGNFENLEAIREFIATDIAYETVKSADLAPAL